MSITTNAEAAAVMLLGRYLAPGCDRYADGYADGRDPVTHDEARDALALLMDSAHRKFMAGPNGDDVRRAWMGRGVVPRVVGPFAWRDVE